MVVTRHRGKTFLTVRGPDGSTIPYPDFVSSLDTSALRQIGARYVALVRQLAASLPAPWPVEDSNQRITDKMPSNYYFVSLVHLALPNAKIALTEATSNAPVTSTNPRTTWSRLCPSSNAA